MGFFNFGHRDILISFEEPKPVYYSFMEMGDVIYYHPPGSKRRIMGTVLYVIHDDNGEPREVTIRTSSGEEITTTTNHIRY